MRKYLGGLLFGGLVFLGGTAWAADNLTTEYMSEYNYPVTDSYSDVKNAYGENTVMAVEDRTRYQVFREKLDKMGKNLQIKQEQQENLTRKLETRKIMLDIWNTRQEDLLNRLVELSLDQHMKDIKAGRNSSKGTVTEEQLAKLKKKLEKKAKQLERSLRKLYRTASREGDYVEIVNAANGKVAKRRLELQAVAMQYAEVYSLLREQGTKVGWSTGSDMQELSLAGYLPLEGRLPKDMSRVEAAERVASLLKALENGVYPDIPEENLKAAARLRTEFSQELYAMGYFEDEAAQIEAETQWGWESAIKKDRRLKLFDELRLDFKKDSGDISNDHHLRLRNRLYADYHLVDSWHAIGMVESTKYLSGKGRDRLLDLERYYITGNIGVATLTAGVFGAEMAEGNIYDSKFQGAMLEAGNPVHYRFRIGNVNDAHNVYTFGAEYKDKNGYRYDGGFHHFDVDGSGKRDILYGNVHIPLGHSYDLGLMYLHGSDATYGNGSGFVATLGHNMDKEWMQGNTSTYLKYYHQPRSTYVQHTMNGTADSMNGFKGWGLGVTHTIKENVLATLELDSLKEIEGGRKNNTIWMAITYMFGDL